jgi:hypothetical protein
MTSQLASYIAVAFACGLMGYVAGFIHERVAWNRLIQLGVLPKPRRTP